MQVGTISSRQLFYLMFCIVVATALPVSEPLAQQARQDVWLTVLIAVGLDVGIGWAAWSLGLRFPGKTLIEYAPQVLGRLPGRLVGVAYIWLFVHAESLIVRATTAFLNLFLPETPLAVLTGLVVAVCSYGAYLGLETLGRSAEIAGPVAIALAVGLPTAVLGEIDAGNWLPVLERGIGRPLFAAFVPASWYGLCVVLCMLMAYHDEPRRALRAKGAGVLAAGVAVTAMMMAAVASLGPGVAARQVLPIFATARRVEIGRFLERVEVFIVGLSLLMVFVTTALLQHASALGLAQWLGLSTFRPLVLPLGLLCGALALALESRLDVVRFIRDVFPLYALSIEAGLTALLLVVAALRGPPPSGREDGPDRGQRRGEDRGQGAVKPVQPPAEGDRDAGAGGQPGQR